MTSPSGWRELAQTPQFDEYTIVLRGELVVDTGGAVHNVTAVQAIIVQAGEWLRYKTPGVDGAETSRYVCRPSRLTRCIVMRINAHV